MEQLLLGVVALIGAQAMGPTQSFQRASEHFDASSESETILTVQLRHLLSVDEIEEITTTDGRAAAYDLLAEEGRQILADFLADLPQGTQVVHRHPQFAIVGLKFAHSDDAKKVLNDERVLDASIDVGEPVNAVDTSAYTGIEIREGIRAQTFLSAGLDANEGNRISPTLPIYMGIVELLVENGIHNHVGYKDTATGPNRVRRNVICSIDDCSSTQPYNTAPGSSHADIVTSTAAGSIEQGQDSLYTSTADRRRRSGVAKETEVVVYNIPVSTDALVATRMTNAVNDALDSGVDILNFSFRMNTLCDGVDLILRRIFGEPPAFALHDVAS
jgi:hypothetical protein